MSRRPLTLALLLAAICAGGAVLALRVHDASVPATDHPRHAAPRFAAEVAATDRAWILSAIAAARPEAQRLIGEVGGAVTFTTAGAGEMMGQARPGPDGYEVWLNVARLDGDRRQDRDVAVLHELGHVVDDALVPPALNQQLDDAIPRGGPCVHDARGSAGGGCTPAPERFADTWAKWALGGAVSAAGAGYMIPTPASLEDWGAPLGALAAELPAA